MSERSHPERRSWPTQACLLAVLLAVHTATLPGQASLDAPAEAPAGSYIQIQWTGPNDQSDNIIVLPEGADNRTFPWAYPAYTSAGSPLWLGLGSKIQEGRFELRYQHAQTGDILARRPITIVPATADLGVPTTVTPDAVFEVKWQGPGGHKDFVGIAEVGALMGRYKHQVDVNQGNPSRLRAPKSGGEYIVRYVMGSSRLAAAEVTIAVGTAPEVADANPERRGRVSVTSSAAKTWVKFASPGELNEYLAQSLVVTYSDDTKQALRFVVGSVVVEPDGRPVSECLSTERSINTGDQLRLPASCGTGGFVTAKGGEAIGKATLGTAFVINHEEQYLTDMRPLNSLGKTAAEQARRLGSVVVAVGAFPVDRERAKGIDTRAFGYPCVRY